MYKGRILIVEDNMDSYELMRFILERHGYEIFLAADGRDGVSAAIKQKPDVILMDLALPELDGWEAAGQLKSNPQTKHIPVVAVTARALPADRQRALDAGCDAYLTKPIDLAELVRMVDGVLTK